MNNIPPIDEPPDDEEPGDPRSKISPTSAMRPVPPSFQNISANGCKNVACENFGVSPVEWPQGKPGRGGGNPAPDQYRIVNTGLSVLACGKCGKNSTLKNNAAIYEERQRLAQGVLDPVAAPACADPACGSTILRKFGTTRHGAPRFQCTACKKTFSIGKSTARQRKPHKNREVFALLVNKTPFRRMAEISELSSTSLYGKIDWLYEQCRSFVAERERNLSGMKFDALNLSTDRQDYMVNWGDRAERRTMQLTAVATAERNSGYVFGFVPNFDKSISPDDLNKQYVLSGDFAKPYAMRKFARLWTKADYQASASKGARREDLDTDENLDENQQLPTTGSQVHADYMMHGHYWLLRHHFQGAEKLNFFLDKDAGLLGACMGAFADRIKNRTADILIVDIEKNLTVPQRNLKNQNARDWFAAERAKFPGMSADAAKLEIMRQIVVGQRSTEEPFNELWFDLPFPDAAEPQKSVRYVTDHNDHETDQETAELMLLATLWPVDTVFNRIRSRLSICDRPFTSVRRARRFWHKYAPYDPAQLEKMLTIYRCWQNYIWKDERKKTTAAEKLGLGMGPIKMEDVLYFK